MGQDFLDIQYGMFYSIKQSCGSGFRLTGSGTVLFTKSGSESTILQCFKLLHTYFLSKKSCLVGIITMNIEQDFLDIL